MRTAMTSPAACSPKGMPSLKNATAAPSFAVDDIDDARNEKPYERSRLEEQANRTLVTGIKIMLIVSSILAVYSVTVRLKMVSNEDLKFVTVLPVYYRAVILIILGGWCWGANVHGLERSHIDYVALFDGDPAAKVPYRAVYATSAIFTLLLLLNVFAFTQAHRIPSTFIPLCLYVTLLLMMTWPRCPFQHARYALVEAFQDVLLSPLLGVTFAHVILADLLTSYSKVFADLYSTVCVILNSVDHRFHPEVLHECRHDVIGPIVASLPSWLRLFQCLRCFATERDHRHLWNSLKYASAFPVLAFSYLKQHHFTSSGMSGILISQGWLLSLLVNSLFSFYWDVYHDWGLGSISSANWLLRDRLLFSRRWWYYGTLVLDLLLRFTWSLQLSPHFWIALGGTVGRELQMFVLEALEILRRCVWIFFRCEWQYISQASKNKVDRPPRSEQYI